MELREFIRNIPDFPAPGVLFRDITPLLRSPGAFKYAITELEKFARVTKPTAIVGVESRGFCFATPVALNLGIPFVPIRKPGKLPHASIEIEYTLEYGKGKLEIHQDALTPKDRVLIIDDVLATGGTAQGSAKLVEKLGASVCGLGFLIELEFLKGRALIAEYQVQSLVIYN